MLVGYLIGLSHIDPLQYDLPLHRFLPEEVGPAPDIDLDFPRNIREELIKELGGFSHGSYTSLGAPSGINTGKKSGNQDHYQGFSSKEAKTVIDKELKDWAKQLRKVQGKVVKSWMTKAKSGVIDYFDIVRGLETGDVARAHPYETKFFKALLDRDKIMNRFRSYFGGKKGIKRPIKR